MYNVAAASERRSASRSVPESSRLTPVVVAGSRTNFRNTNCGDCSSSYRVDQTQDMFRWILTTACLLLLVQNTSALTERSAPSGEDTLGEFRMLNDLFSNRPDLQMMVLRSLIRSSEDSDAREVASRGLNKRRPGGSCVSGCLSQGGMSFVRCKSLCR